jgi:two-component system chemotaxis sensor kinase CheA
MDLSHYRELFVAEARSHLSSFNGLVVRLEDGVDRAAIDELFRHAHSLKGMAATMGYEPLSRLAHAMESQLSTVRSGEASFSGAFADLMLVGSDALAAMVSQVEQKCETICGDEQLVEMIAAFVDNSPPEITATGISENTTPPSYQPRQTDSFTTVRIKAETLDHLINITGELITIRHKLSETVRRSGSREFEEPLHELSSLLRNLRDEVFTARMLPFGTIAERFPRLVRDLARSQGKEIIFQLEGHEIELDRGVLEEIAEPLVHILRNAVDHGMEMPDERVAAGKPRNGVVSMKVIRDKDHVEVVIADDGRGMNPHYLKLLAIEKGVISAEQAEIMTPQESLQLICAPGFSTARTVSDISGRGVGMDAVRTVVHAVGGTLNIQSDAGQGSRFVLRLPLSISIIHVLMVQSGQIDIAFPVASVARTLELKRTDIFEESGQKMILLDGTNVPVRSLNRLLRQPLGAASVANLVPAVVCDVGGSLIAFIADHIHGQQEIFVKPLGRPLSLLRGISGASITGDGRVIFVADATALG